MALSRDFRQFNFPQHICYHSLLALLPYVYVRVEPFTHAHMQIEAQNLASGEIRTKAQVNSTPGVGYYRYKFTCTAQNENSCKVQVEAATMGITDVGLGQVTLRQLLITLNLALNEKLPPGQLPLFLLKPAPTLPHSMQAIFEQQVNQAFQMAKQGKADDALDAFQKALKLIPASPDVHFYVGVLFMLLGYLAEAATAFKQTLTLNRHHVLAQAYYDDVQLRLNQQRQAVKIDPKMPTPHISTESIPGTGQAPGDTQSHVNPDEVETMPVKTVGSGKLLIRTPDGAIKEYELKRPVTTIGRLEGSDILLADVKVSRQHAEIVCIQGSCMFTDLGSANGTFYNGQHLQPKQGQQLNSGDVLRLGDVEIIYSNLPSQSQSNQ